MIEGGAAYGELAVTGEALHGTTQQDGSSKGGTRGDSRPNEAVQGADDSVVVKKFRPENAGNRREDKTGTIPGRGRGDDATPKACIGCEGRKFIRKFLSVVGLRR